jgi:hypothetical protein
MKVLGYCILHYGRPYLGYAVQSLLDQVDDILILYTDKPSQGFQSTIPCPDSEEDLQAEVMPFMDRITWGQGRVV